MNGDDSRSLPPVTAGVNQVVRFPMRRHYSRAALCGILAALTANPILAQGLGSLKGLWRGDKSEPKALRVNDDSTYEITWYNSTTETGSIKLTTTGDTRHIVLTASSGPYKGQTRKGIFLLGNEGGKRRLTIYVGKPGGEEAKLAKKDPGRFEEWK